MITFRMLASITKNIRPPEKIKYWNELDGSIFLSKIFSHPVEIRKIALFSLRVENDQPCVGIGFDIPEFPDNLPEKWKNKGYHMCRLGVTCNDIDNLKTLNIPAHEVFTVKNNKKNRLLNF